MRTLFYYCLAILLSSMTQSCMHQCSFKDVYNVEFSQVKSIALSTGKDFCFVLIRDSSEMEQYKNILYKQNCADLFIWNFVNISNPYNQWLQLLIGSSKTPFTLKFNRFGQCNDIIYGVSKYAFNHVKNNSEESPSYFGFYENSIIPRNVNVTNLVDLLFTYKYTKQQQYLDQSIEEFRYPYNLLLKAHTYTDKDSIDTIYKEILLECYDPSTPLFFRQIYKPLYDIIISEKRILNLSIPKAVYHCNVNDTVDIKIMAQNNSPLSSIQILKIEPSCTCVNEVGSANKTILPLQTNLFNFTFFAETPGEYYREIAFYNDTELRVEYISFLVIVE